MGACASSSAAVESSTAGGSVCSSRSMRRPHDLSPAHTTAQLSLSASAPQRHLHHPPTTPSKPPILRTRLSWSIHPQVNTAAATSANWTEPICDASPSAIIDLPPAQPIHGQLLRHSRSPSWQHQLSRGASSNLSSHGRVTSASSVNLEDRAASHSSLHHFNFTQQQQQPPLLNYSHSTTASFPQPQPQSQSQYPSSHLVLPPAHPAIGSSAHHSVFDFTTPTPVIAIVGGSHTLLPPAAYTPCICPEPVDCTEIEDYYMEDDPDYQAYVRRWEESKEAESRGSSESPHDSNGRSLFFGLQLEQQKQRKLSAADVPNCLLQCDLPQSEIPRDDHEPVINLYLPASTCASPQSGTPLCVSPRSPTQHVVAHIAQASLLDFMQELIEESNQASPQQSRFNSSASARSSYSGLHPSASSQSRSLSTNAAAAAACILATPHDSPLSPARKHKLVHRALPTPIQLPQQQTIGVSAHHFRLRPLPAQ